MCCCRCCCVGRPSSIYAALGEYVTDELAGSVVVSNNAGASFTTLLAPPPYNTTAASYTVRETEQTCSAQLKMQLQYRATCCNLHNTAAAVVRTMHNACRPRHVHDAHMCATVCYCHCCNYRCIVCNLHTTAIAVADFTSAMQV